MLAKLHTICFLVCLSTTSVAQEVTVGSFNIRFFGSSDDFARSKEEIKALATYIKDMNCDVVCCQEIDHSGDANENGKRDLRELMDSLGDKFSSWYGQTGGGQGLLFIWRNDRVELKDRGELNGIHREKPPGSNKKSFPRIPLSAYVRPKNGGPDFRLITVHLYWGNNKARFHEAKQLNSWVKAYLAEHGSDKDVLLIGDCNTKPLGQGESGQSKTIDNLEKDGRLNCVSKSHDEYTTPTSRERYDHAFLSKFLLEKYVDDSWDVLRSDHFPSELTQNGYQQYKRQVSDHVPVKLILSGADNDQTSAGDWAKPRRR